MSHRESGHFAILLGLRGASDESPGQTEKDHPLVRLRRRGGPDRPRRGLFPHTRAQAAVPPRGARGGPPRRAGRPRTRPRDSPSQTGVPPAWVDWRSTNPLVLCRFELAESLRTPELAPYDDTAVLEWRPLRGERISFAIETGPLRTAGSFRTFALFSGIDAPGVLISNGRIVGWTFGQGVARGYLWAPADGAGPKPLLAPADLAGSLRGAGTREAGVLHAMAMADEVAAERQLGGFAARLPRGA